MNERVFTPLSAMTAKVLSGIVMGPAENTVSILPGSFLYSDLNLIIFFNTIYMITKSYDGLPEIQTRT